MKKTAKKRATTKTGVTKKTADTKRNARRKITAPAPPSVGTEPTTTPRQSKKDIVLSLLRRDEGATLNEIMTATKWQVHSVRGFISGTAKKALGLTINHVQRNDGTSAYRVVHE